MEREVGREYIRKHDESREFPDEAYQKIADRGWLGLLIPEAYGGLDADPVMYAIFCEAIAKFSLDFAAAVMTSMFTATNIASHGTAEQRQRYLPGFLAGETKFSVSITEPGSGSDAASLQTRAVADGDDFVLNGNKVFCSGAHLPNTVITVLARDRPGQAQGAQPDPGAEHCARHRHPQAEHDGAPEPGHHRDLPDRCAGAEAERHRRGRRGLDLHRRAPGVRAAEPGRDVRGQRAHRAGRHHRLHEGPHPVRPPAVLVPGAQAPDGGERVPGRGGPAARLQAATKMARGERAIKEVSMAKVFASDVAFKVAFNGMQALGGYAQLPEYDMERYFREAKHAMVGGGTTEIQHSIIAREMGL